jgi:uncharacterized membrane-anchored protein YitT (DUF2179 family)
MPKISEKYKRKIGIAFLYFYVLFLLVGTIHYHIYDLNPKDSFQSEVNADVINDLTIDFFSVCSLHQFSQTIDNIHYSSSDIIQSLSVLESNLFFIRINNFLSVEYTKTSPRAPPLFIS